MEYVFHPMLLYFFNIRFNRDPYGMMMGNNHLKVSVSPVPDK